MNKKPFYSIVQKSAFIFYSKSLKKEQIYCIIITINKLDWTVL